MGGVVQKLWILCEAKEGASRQTTTSRSGSWGGGGEIHVHIGAMLVALTGVAVCARMSAARLLGIGNHLSPFCYFCRVALLQALVLTTIKA